jgi:hypothetical protein
MQSMGFALIDFESEIGNYTVLCPGVKCMISWHQNTGLEGRIVHHGK